MAIAAAEHRGEMAMESLLYVRWRADTTAVDHQAAYQRPFSSKHSADARRIVFRYKGHSVVTPIAMRRGTYEGHWVWTCRELADRGPNAVYILSRASICDYPDRMDASGRRFVSRACMVCEWHGEAVEREVAPGEWPWGHAPTRGTRQEWRIPMLGNKKLHAAAGARLSRLG